MPPISTPFAPHELPTDPGMLCVCIPFPAAISNSPIFCPHISGERQCLPKVLTPLSYSRRPSRHRHVSKQRCKLGWQYTWMHIRCTKPLSNVPRRTGKNGTWCTRGGVSGWFRGIPGDAPPQPLVNFHVPIAGHLRILTDKVRPHNNRYTGSKALDRNALASEYQVRHRPTV